MAVSKPTFLIRIPIKRSRILQILKRANKADKGLPGDILNPVPIADMPENIRNESKRDNEAFSFRSLACLSSNERHNGLEAGCAMDISRDHAAQPMDRPAGDLD